MIIEEEKDRGPALLLIIIYTTSKYVHDESRCLKYSMAEAEQYSRAGGSPPLKCVSPCGLKDR